MSHFLLTIAGRRARGKVDEAEGVGYLEYPLLW